MSKWMLLMLLMITTGCSTQYVSKARGYKDNGDIISVTLNLQNELLVFHNGKQLGEEQNWCVRQEQDDG